MTPEKYLEQNPTALIFRHEISKDGHSSAMFRPGGGKGWSHSQNDLILDWTGYTEPHVMIGPEFPQSRKLEVKWDKWRITPDKVNKGDVPFQMVELPDGGTCFRIGKYTDAPVKSKPELSRFLPDGCKWRMSEDGTEWYIELQESWLFPTHQVKTWNYLGLLHPSEGGGFQKHTPGDPMPCDGKLRVDVIAEIGDINYGYEAESWLWGHCYNQSDIYGWRPHYKEEN